MPATDRVAALGGTNQRDLKSGVSGNVYSCTDTFEVTTADIDTGGEIIRLCTLPANAILHRIVLFHDDLDTNATETLTMNVGIYAAAGAVDDADGFASALDWGDADLTGTDVLWEAGASGGYSNISNVGKQLWEHIGAASIAAAATYDLVLTVGTGAATAAAGTISYCVEYST